MIFAVLDECLPKNRYIYAETATIMKNTKKDGTIRQRVADLAEDVRAEVNKKLEGLAEKAVSVGGLADKASAAGNRAVDALDDVADTISQATREGSGVVSRAAREIVDTVSRAAQDVADTVKGKTTEDK